MKLDQEKRQFNDVLGYLHREIFTCEVHLKQVEKDLVGASKVMQVRDSVLNFNFGTRASPRRRATSTQSTGPSESPFRAGQARFRSAVWERARGVASS